MHTMSVKPRANILMPSKEIILTRLTEFDNQHSLVTTFYPKLAHDLGEREISPRELARSINYHYQQFRNEWARLLRYEGKITDFKGLINTLVDNMTLADQAVNEFNKLSQNSKRGRKKYVVRKRDIEALEVLFIQHFLHRLTEKGYEENAEKHLKAFTDAVMDNPNINKQTLVAWICQNARSWSLLEAHYEANDDE